jgi:MoaA/NifB/PqqE/SkfB family radical SAM enzyme
MELGFHNIQRIEIGLINKCNIVCPLCIRNQDDFKTIYATERKYIDIKILKDFLLQFKQLEFLEIMGTLSEPTLYPDLFELLEFCNENNIRFGISTNGSTNIDWERLGGLTTNNSYVKFAIDGSNQEIYSRYRIGGTLKNIIQNHKNYKKYNNSLSILQFIYFDHNVLDFDNIVELKNIEGFDELFTIECENICDDYISEANLGPRESIKKVYKLNNKINDNINETQDGTIDCKSMKYKYIYMNHDGGLMPCCNVDDKYFFGKDRINIHNSTYQKCFDYLNGLIDNRYNHTDCKKHCHLTTKWLEDKLNETKSWEFFDGNK